jgi:hypothetical protein
MAYDKQIDQGRPATPTAKCDSGRTLRLKVALTYVGPGAADICLKSEILNIYLSDVIRRTEAISKLAK